MMHTTNTQMNTRPAWWFYWRLIRFVPWIYALNLSAIIAVLLLDLAPGLLAREFFNTLSGQARAGLDLWTLTALLVMTGVGQVLFLLVLPMTNTTFVFTAGALLRKNLLARVLERPGARALPASSGEAVRNWRALSPNGMPVRPALARFAAMPPPMLPRPMKATVCVMANSPLIWREG